MIMSLRRAIMDAFLFADFKNVKPTGYEERADLFITWRGKRYLVTAVKMPDEDKRNG